MNHVDNLMGKAVLENVFPGAVLLAAEKGEIIIHKAYGRADIYSDIKVDTETVFDLASLTKPLATSLAIMKLMEETPGLPEQKLGSILGPACKTGKAGIKIKHLLSHTSGFPDYKPYYVKLKRNSCEAPKPFLRELIINENLEYAPGTKVVYSDLGFMMLEWIIEILAGETLDCFLDREIYSRLGLNNLFYVDVSCPVKKKVFAATELCPWRKKLLKGVVHDDNAYAAGGIQGHAGLFGTAEDVFILLNKLLLILKGDEKHSIFKKKIVQSFIKPYKDTGRSLGFDMPDPVCSSSGSFFSKNSFGHLGFTGTSFWMDIDRSIILILLTNRVHPYRHNIKIKNFRPIVHNAVMEKIISK